MAMKFLSYTLLSLCLAIFFHSYLVVLLNIYLLLQYIDCHEFITYVSG